MSGRRNNLARAKKANAEPEAVFGVDATTLKWWREAPLAPRPPNETAQERMDKLYEAMVRGLR